tara:strand:- start:1129 stop:2169 length:1041 start_codon:yes stop_codon:yes gene_type:complete
LQEQLDDIRRKALDELAQISNVGDLDEWRVNHLGRNGSLTTVLRQVGSLAPDERKEAGANGNKTKTLLETSLEKRTEEITNLVLEEKLKNDRIDVTLPGTPLMQGRMHPTMQTIQEITNAFVAMGFQILEGPEVEWDYYNFEALNIPPGHPARDMWNTFWVDYEDKDGNRPMLLRTHTSPMQVRTMENREPPVRVVIPGRCYRYEATDATHESSFFQIEGLTVGEGITFADLKGTLYEFARRIFGMDRQIRFRCDYFPFVEPGVDMSIDCFNCQGKGCRVCSSTGWIEIMGAGMVHPEVLRRVGYDPEKYTGFAFGMGPERIAMLRHGIEDIRLFYSNDIRFLQQF